MTDCQPPSPEIVAQPVGQQLAQYVLQYIAQLQQLEHQSALGGLVHGDQGGGAGSEGSDVHPPLVGGLSEDGGHSSVGEEEVDGGVAWVGEWGGVGGVGWGGVGWGSTDRKVGEWEGRCGCVYWSKITVQVQSQPRPQ